MQPDLQRVGEGTEIAGRHEPRHDAHLAVARVVVSFARGQVCLHADGGGESVSVFAQQAKVGREAKITDPRAGRGTESRSDRASVFAILVRGDGQVQREAQAFTENDATSDVHEELITDQKLSLGTIRPVEHQRLVRIVASYPERESPRSTEVERFVREPVTPVLGRIEAVERKALRLPPRGPGVGGQEKARQGGEAAAESLRGGHCSRDS